ncbi:uncharacterized protein LOC108740226 [Agrilus planipennis]|uniref:Uncharacterized protein LOC108740226 n=1 Tax=Agrilus planipennis TaxID=224129 RepID=A0A1W4X1G2_AGRPL|nr:uncharacterized protein LOC108740226 [Agrilus planipennis]
MRMSIHRVTKTSTANTMMRVPVKKKKVEAKAIDSISETISFVIKGKLTSLKPTVLTKKQMKIKAMPNSSKKVKITKRKDKLMKYKKVPEMKKANTKKKAEKEKESMSNIDKLIQQKQSLDEPSVAANKTGITEKNKKGKEGNSVSKKTTPKIAKKKVQNNTESLNLSDLKGASRQIYADNASREEEKSPENTSNISDKTNTKKKEKADETTPQRSKKIKNKTRQANKMTVKCLKGTNKEPHRKEIPFKRNMRNKIKKERLSGDELSNSSDEISLVSLSQQSSERPEVKSENIESSRQEADKLKNFTKQSINKAKTTPRKQKPTVQSNLKNTRKMLMMKKKMLTKDKEENKMHKMKLLGLWNGPRRHRVASLNALAKVHCLYENETRSAFLDDAKKVVYVKKEKDPEPKEIEDSPPPMRNLRAAPRLGSVGKHWDMHEMSSSSSEDNDSVIEQPKVKAVLKRIKQEAEVERNEEKQKTEKKRRRNRTEIIMDLKDMVVRKRMASLNATAILAASYSTEKKSSKSSKSDDTDSSDSDESFVVSKSECKKIEEDIVKKEEEPQVIELRATPNKKVSVILNQDTDVTITGVYVNSTTRSTHHEGYCSIAGMQYRISATSHTQTAAAAMTTENLLQSPSVSENNIEENISPVCKSYTPLGALSNMKPPGAPDSQHGMALGHSPHHLGLPHMVPVGPSQHGPPAHLSPANRRHVGCTSAFSAPPSGHFGASPGHPVAEQGYTHGYYQPAGPLITAPPHGGHPQQQVPPTLAPTKAAPLSSEPSTSPTPPPPSSQQPTLRPPPPSSATESSDSDVIITSPPVVKETIPTQPPPPVSFRYSQYSSPHHGYSYSYTPQYYPGPPPAPSYPHHDLCYSTPPYLHKAYPTAYRRYLAPPSGAQFFQTPSDIYNPPQPTANPPGQQMVAANPAANGSSYQQPPGAHPPSALIESYAPPPTLLDPYAPPYYSGYGPAPPPSCYTHSTPTRTIPYLNAAYSSCPCPMQSCPKNVHAGPLTGDSKRSVHMSIAKDSLPLPPVALALPLEPVNATDPPSPARGSAGMPPPPSPAGATYQPPPPAPKQESIGTTEYKPAEKCRKARIGKSMVRSNIAANFPENTMLLMCQAPQQNANIANVKREIESPEQKKEEKLDEVESSDLKHIANNVESVILSEETLITTTETQNNFEMNVRSTEVDVKEEEKSDKESDDNVIEEESKRQEVKDEELLPCVKTVAENVKMKNMKRKLSMSKEVEKGEAPIVLPSKKPKIDKVKANGSYKDLIKKNVPCVKINNGKRKLITDSTSPKLVTTKSSKKKRKLALSKDDSVVKRTKLSKPLTSNNQLVNPKTLRKEGKYVMTCFLSELNENTEPGSKVAKKNSKCSVTTKKLAPVVLDNLFAKNSVDRTIECVVSNCWENGSRTIKKSDANSKSTSKSKFIKAETEPVTIKSTNVKPSSDQCKQKVQKVNSRKKVKCKEEPPLPLAITKPRKSALLPRWSNGWTWAGEPFQAKVFLNSDEATVVRTCYPAMVHVEGDRIEARDCVLLKAGQKKNELPFVAKVAALWENPEDGEMMMSLLWYYRPEHTEQGPQPTDEHDEVFASRHKDTNSVACIEDKCYVLTFNEYCRYRKNLRRLEENLEETKPFVPNPEIYPRTHRQPSNPRTPSDLVFFCRRVYDFRQKRIVKNPS